MHARTSNANLHVPYDYVQYCNFFVASSCGASDMRAVGAAFTAVPTSSPQYPLVDVTSCERDSYCIGYRTGAALGTMIRSRLVAAPYMRDYRTFYHSDEGRRFVSKLAAANYAWAPHLELELNGLADGARASPVDMLMLNLRTELGLRLRNKTGASGAQVERLQAAAGRQLVDSCTDLLIANPPAMAHNEDNARDTVNHAYWVVGRIAHAPRNTSDHTRWTAFTYAGELPTGAFGVSAGPRLLFLF